MWTLLDVFLFLPYEEAPSHPTREQATYNLISSPLTQYSIYSHISPHQIWNATGETAEQELIFWTEISITREWWRKSETSLCLALALALCKASLDRLHEGWLERESCSLVIPAPPSSSIWSLAWRAYSVDACCMSLRIEGGTTVPNIITAWRSHNMQNETLLGADL